MILIIRGPKWFDMSRVPRYKIRAIFIFPHHIDAYKVVVSFLFQVFPNTRYKGQTTDEGCRKNEDTIIYV